MIFHSSRLGCIYIDLEEPNVLVLLAQGTDLRGNLLARAAISRIEVNEDGTGRDESREDVRAVCEKLEYLGGHVREPEPVRFAPYMEKESLLTCQHCTPTRA